MDPDQTASFPCTQKNHLNETIVFNGQYNLSQLKKVLVLTGLIFGGFYNIPNAKKYLFFPIFGGKFPISNQKKLKKNHHFYHGKSWLKTVEYSTLHSHAMVIIIQH